MDHDALLSKFKKGSLEFTIEERTMDQVTSTMPITPGVLNPFGTIHAGAMIWLADVTATALALGGIELGPNGAGFPLAVNVQTHLLSNQQEGEITAVASYVRRGRRVSVIRTQVLGTGDKLLAEVTTTHVPAG